MHGTIFNIQDFCLDDGPGIRTTVFLKGCPLRCAWCHNPESQNKDSELLYNSELCIFCKKCASVCPNGVHCFENSQHILRREKCSKCGKCLGVCFSGALELCGKEQSLKEILSVLDDNLPFYKNSGGGLTISGGEPLSQPDFTLALCREAKKRGIHVCVETSGYGTKEAFLSLLPFIDIFLFDYKLTKEDEHIAYTGVSNRKILENLALLNQSRATVILRCPIIPSVNFSEEHFNSIERLVGNMPCIKEVHLLPYHPLGIEKSKKLGKISTHNDTQFLDKSKLLPYMRQLQKNIGLPVKIIG